MEIDECAKNNLTSTVMEADWTLPHGNFVKINFDASYDDQTLEAASGVVIRFATRDILASKASFHTGMVSSFAAEAMACLEGVRLGVDLGLIEVLIEGDLRTTISKCQTETKDKSLISAYISDIHHHKLSFRSDRFQHIFRHANKVAHNIAFESFKRKGSFYMSGVVPSYVRCIVKIDRPREPD